MHPGVLLLIGIGFLAVLAWILWPKSGLLSRLSRLQKESERIHIEDALKHLYNKEHSGETATIDSLTAELPLSRNAVEDLLKRMESHGLLTLEKDLSRLTSEGNAYASRVVRAHRLWERFLADQTGFPNSEWHTMAHAREHTATPEEIADLAHRLGNPLYDPHGDPIPTENGEISPPLGSPIVTFSVGDAVAVTHIEDEPPELYSQLVAEGIYPGMQMRILEKNEKRFRFVSQEDEHVLSPEVAALITARELPKEDKPERSQATLASLRIGEAARVLSLSPKCRGLERRRLMDLGIVPGTVLRAELENPLGTPIAYRVRGTLIALREELAEQIAVEKIQETAS